MAHAPHLRGHGTNSQDHNHSYLAPVPRDEVLVLAGSPQHSQHHQKCSRSVASHHGLVGGVSVSTHYIPPKVTHKIQESPTLDLAEDCFRFVTGYFEIISASSPHIYHSALVAAPKDSIVRKLYESHSPFHSSRMRRTGVVGCKYRGHSTSLSARAGRMVAM